MLTYGACLFEGCQWSISEGIYMYLSLEKTQCNESCGKRKPFGRESTSNSRSYLSYLSFLLTSYPYQDLNGPVHCMTTTLRSISLDYCMPLDTHFTRNDRISDKMPSFASLTDFKAYHIIAYGALLGSNVYQSFIAGPFAYSALARPQFATLQTKITPPYFAIQTVLPLFLALTWPGEKVAGASFRKNVGWRGVLEPGNFGDALVPFGLMFGTALLNLGLLGPMTTKVMKERKYQGENRSSQCCIALLTWYRNEGRKEIL